MYELSCPSCAHVTRLPFVRIGAVATCEECDTRFQIERKHVQHHAEPVDTSAEDESLFSGSAGGLTGEGGEPGAGRIDSYHGSGGSGGSGEANASMLSGNVGAGGGVGGGSVGVGGRGARHVGGVGAGGGAGGGASGGASVGVGGRPRSSRESGRVRGGGPARRRGGRRGVGWGVVSWLLTLGAMLGFVVAGLFWMAMEWGLIGDGNVVEPEPVVAAEDTVPDYRLTYGLDIVDPEIVNPTPWTSTSDMYMDTERDEGAVVVRRESNYVDPEGRHVLAAIVENKGERTISLAYLTLSLVDETAQVFARSLVPVVMLRPNSPREISVDVPDELMTRFDSIGWSVEVINELPRSVALLGVALSVEAINPGPDGLVKIEAVNRTGQMLSELMFLFRATDETGRVVGSWRYQLRDLLALDQKISFLAATPIFEEIGPMAWSVEAVGVIADPLDRRDHGGMPEPLGRLGRLGSRDGANVKGVNGLNGVDGLDGRDDLDDDEPVSDQAGRRAIDTIDAQPPVTTPE